MALPFSPFGSSHRRGPERRGSVIAGVKSCEAVRAALRHYHCARGKPAVRTRQAGLGGVSVEEMT